MQLKDSGLVTRDPIFTPGFLLLATAQAAQGVGVLLVYSSIALLVIQHLHASAPTAGVVIGVMFTASFLARLPVGAALDRAKSDRHRIKLFGMTGAAGLAAASLLFILAGMDRVRPAMLGDMPLGSLVAAAVAGASLSVYSTASTAQVAKVVPITRRGEAVGCFFGFGTVGTAVGGGSSFGLFNTFGYGAPFAAAMLLYGVAVILWTRMPSGAGNVLEAPPMRPVLRLENRVLAPSFASFCLLFGNSAAFAFVPLLGVARDIPNPGIFFALNGVAALASRFVGADLVDRIGILPIVIPGLALHGIGLALASQASSTETLAIAGLVVGLGFAVVSSGTTTLTIDLAGSQRRGAAIATYSGITDVGIVLGIVVSGQIVPLLGYGGLLLAMSALPFAGLTGLLVWRAQHGPVMRTD